jgi:DNA-binding CsgD family transcriptional regulator
MAGLAGKLSLEFYRLALGTPPAQFQDAVLDRVKEHLPFDTALWGTVAPGPDAVEAHSGHLYGLPWQMIDEYQRVKHLDWMLRASLANPGRTINGELARTKPTLDPAMIAHCERWGMRQVLGTLIDVPELGLSMGICLYRADAKRPFSERERRLMQALVPHLAESFQVNTLHFLGHRGEGERAVARVDAHGVLHQGEPGLVALVRREVNDWSGPRVPEEWLSVLAPNAPSYRGKAVVVTLVRRMDDLTYLLQVRRSHPVDRLSPRELAVVRELSRGKTHRAIAALLGTSPATVRTQIRTAYDKLGVRSRAELGQLIGAVD